jgi:HK97 family phage major capsid protein/HK97 family phage prohead protease
MDRAYSVLHIKGIDDEKRVITGIATTPTPDRMGDIIEPLGVTYKNPLPLLLYHDHRSPVGTVQFDKPTKDGINFTAKIAAIAEPGRLKDRVDEAWQSVKARLVRGVSIGFRVLNDAVDYMKDTGGMRFRETEVLELSLVAVRANQDATITSIKQFDTSAPAAPGTAGRVSSFTRSGASDSPQRARTMNLSERITAKRAELKTKSARLEELVQKTDGQAPSDAEAKETVDLTADIDALTSEIKSLEALERAQALQASPVAHPRPTSAADTGQKDTRVVVTDPLPKGIEFARFVMCRMAQVISGVPAYEIAKQKFPDHPRIALALKTAVNPMTTADGASTGGTALVYAQNLVSEFVEWLRPQTIIGKFGANGIPSLRRVPFNVRIVGQTSGASGYWVGQTVQKPLTRFNTAVNNTLTWAKVASICVISDELARFSSPSAETLVRDELARAQIERIDTDFVDPTVAAVANVSPAAITNGIVALTPTGTDAAAVRADIAQLLAGYITANIDPSNVVFIMPPGIALAIGLMRNALGQKEFPDLTMKGGTLEGFPVIVSQYCVTGSPSSSHFIAVDASNIFLADDGQVAIDVSREASLEMSDAPGDEDRTVVSMFQTNQLALRAERYVNWALRRAEAVAYLDGVAYTSGSPS